MRRLICWLIGHDYRMFPNRADVTFQIELCARCKKTRVDFEELARQWRRR